MMRKAIRYAAAGLVSAAFAAAAPAQDTNQVGPAELRNFQLGPPPPTSAAPPVVIPAPAPAAPVTIAPPPPVPEDGTPAASQPSARSSQARRRSEPDPAAPSSIESVSNAAGAPAQDVSPLPTLREPTSPEVPPPSAATPAPRSSRADLPWMWAAAAATAIALLGLAASLFRRRRRGEDAEIFAADEATASERFAPAQFAGDPAPSAPASAAPRPWLELEFRPSRASANDAHAQIQYELVIQNNGDAAAHQVVLEARLLNAGADQDREIAGFFERAGPQEQLEAPLTILPGARFRLRGLAAMPRSAVREVRVESRSLFIPMVAVNARYRWTGGQGQTSASYLVGRQPESPGARMAPFRLDLGPRVYGSLDHRPGALALRT